MFPRSLIILAVVLLLGLSGAAVHYPSSSSCCSRHTSKPLPIRVIIGYKEQSRGENCRIDAIIFLTIKQIEVCANPEDEWVKRILAKLSAKLEKMSKSNSGGRLGRKSGKASVPDKGGYVVNTTEYYLNNTEGFY